jgi:phosphate/sulfate permease
MTLFHGAILILCGLAIADLMVGVSNDAVNFMNSSLGSRVASRRVILFISSLGILVGVTFSSGMMEVARKGIFNPQFFSMPELMVAFLAVMLTDIILLDLYNTFGLPTSTTVSIVFELLGAAVAVSLLKLHQAGNSLGEVVNYINTGKALAIIFGILLSVVVAFLVGAAVQFISRIIFTFNYQKLLRRWGALYGGIALAIIVYFILIKGAKGASFISDDVLTWIKTHTELMLLFSFVASAIFLQFIMWFTRINILKIIVLVGCFALAMAFAANDLVNFIGVPLAGLSAYTEASGSGNLLTHSMEALREPVRGNTAFLLIAGAIMVAALWSSRKARTVSKTELTLGRQEEGYERFESSRLSQTIVRFVAAIFKNMTLFVPRRVKMWIEGRFDRSSYRPTPAADGTVPAFDLVRASVNLMVASALIAWATSLKLPLSTTYVTFMVSMGSSLSDQAWGRDSAVFRVTGVLTVVGGWFFTAMMAFSVSSLFAAAIWYGRAFAVIGILGLAILIITRTHLTHRKREKEDDALEVFNLSKITDSTKSINITFEHTGIFLSEVRNILRDSYEGLRDYDRAKLRRAMDGQKRIQSWSNIITANIFKVLRLLSREELENTQRYAQTISTLQEISESLRDIVVRAQRHVHNQHSRLLEGQIAEMERVHGQVSELLELISEAISDRGSLERGIIAGKNRDLRVLIHEYDQNQVMRIQDNSSKTRLSILFYSFIWDLLKIAEQTTHLLSLFRDPLLPPQPKKNHHPAPVNSR